MSNPKVVFEALPNRYVIQFKSPGDDWAFIKSKPTLEAAKEYAQQSMDYMSADSASLWRVVDTQPEEVATGRRIVEDVITGDQTPAERFASWRLERKASRQAAREYEARRCYPSSTRPNY